MKEYVMKNLGYKRTPTNAWLKVEMPNGEFWKVPAQIIADSRDEHYAEDEEDTIGFIRTESLDSYELIDWAANNMNWNDVQNYAVQMKLQPKVDFEEGWSNGDKEIMGKL